MARLILNWWIFNLMVTVYVMPAPVRNDLNTAIRYLRRYRYFPSEMDASEELVLSALRMFQQENGLPETGDLDDATFQLMENPTCRETESSATKELGSRRERRYTIAQGVKWTKRDITYNVTNSPPGLTLLQVKETFRRAFDSWQSICGLNFAARDSPFADPADIQIQFSQGYHGDQQSFDGPGGLLAHANTPFNNGMGIHGDIHLDIQERWVLTFGGVNLYQVALHEIGHTLALGHSDPNTVMHALYQSSYNPNFRLQPDDIMAAQYLYGPNDRPMEEMDDPEVAPRPDDTCVNTVDAIASLDDGSVFAFTGQEVHHIAKNKTRVAGFPKTLVETFGDVMDSVAHVDAAIYWSRFQKLYIFVGSNYYRYGKSSPETDFRRTPDAGFPRPIADHWPGIPSNIDAATITNDDSVYIFKGDLIYKFGFYSNTYSVLPGYPKEISKISTQWKALSTMDIEAAMQWTDGDYYILSGDYYYRMHSQYEFLWPGYPKSLSRDWFGCDILEQRG